MLDKTLGYILCCQSPGLFVLALLLLVLFLGGRSHKVKSFFRLLLCILCAGGGVALYFLGIYKEYFTIRDFFHIRPAGWVGLVIAAVIVVLLIVSLLIISNTVKLAMYDRKDEIAIMKMVGATNGFIRLPFVVEGFTLGMMGAILAFGLEWVGYDALIQKIAAVDALQLFNFVPFQELLIPMVIVFAAAGMFVGIVGSWTSIRKFMNV